MLTNIFLQLQSEVYENLKKMSLNYEENHIKGFKDTAIFIYTRLSSEAINKYSLITTRKEVVDYFRKTSELITKVNTYADNLTSEPNKKIRQLYINMFLQNKEVLYEYHLNIIDRIENILSYKQYENLNFNKPLRKIDKDSLKNIFIQKSLYEQNKLGATN